MKLQSESSLKHKIFTSHQKTRKKKPTNVFINKVQDWQEKLLKVSKKKKKKIL